MQMRLAGRVTAGLPALDNDIRALFALDTGSGTRLYALTGTGGGVLVLDVRDGPIARVEHSFSYPVGLPVLAPQGFALSGLDRPGEIIIGQGTSGIWTVDLAVSGRVQSVAEVPWAQARQLSDNGNAAFLQAMSGAGRLPDAPFGQTSIRLTDITAMSLPSAGPTMLALSQDQHAVLLYRQSPENGNWGVHARLGAPEGLGIGLPVAMELVEQNGRHWVVVASAGSSSLSVMELRSNGSLRATDHVIDTSATRFAHVQAMTSVQADGMTLVVAGGSDGGLTFFLLTRAGRLVTLGSVAHTFAAPLQDITALQAVVTATYIHIFAASEAATGLVQFSIARDALGRVFLAPERGNATLTGGAGDDILLAGLGRATLTGGAGRDVFVLRDTAERMVITDFEPGIDRLDLSDWPMLRMAGQLLFQSTASGAIIRYRDNLVEVNSAAGGPLSLAQVFPLGLDWADRMLLGAPVSVQPAPPQAEQRTEAPPAPPTEPIRPDSPVVFQGGRTERGTSGPDTMIGGTGNDDFRSGRGDDMVFLFLGNNSVRAGGGHDTVWGGAGHDTIRGGPGNDLIDARAGGQNRLQGGSGNDTIWGGPGADTIQGGGGADMIMGGAGNDRLVGGGGNDTIWGDAGHDLLRGQGGNDILIGGPGNDTLDGGKGNDRLWGGPGADQFVFVRRNGTNTIEDFNPLEGDRLALARNLLDGSTTAVQVLERFARLTPSGDVLLDFAGASTSIRLRGFGSIEDLGGAIDIF